MLRIEGLERRELLAADCGLLASDLATFLESIEQDEPHHEVGDHDDHDHEGEIFGPIEQQATFGASTGFASGLGTNPPRPITERVTVQPIIVSNSNGSNSAEYFGNSAQQSIIQDHIDTIWAQAGIDIAWLAPIFWNDTFANVGNQDPRPNNDLAVIGESGDAEGVGNSNPLVLDVYFVEVSAGFGPRDDNVANGLAWVGANGVTIHVGDNLVTWPGGQEVVARVTAHEIGHNLGLSHITASGNLMTPGSREGALNSTQVTAALNSQFSVPLPTNTPPSIQNPIADQSLSTNDAPRQISIANVFSDADGDNLTYEVSTSNAAISATLNGTVLTLSVNSSSAATTVVNVTANDGRGGSVTDSLLVTVSVAPPPSTDWGIVDFRNVSGQTISGTRWYRLTASQAGLVTVVSEWTAGSNPVALEVFDSQLNSLQTGTVSGNTNRVDVGSALSDTFYVQVTGTNTVDFRVANLVSLNGSSVAVSGTSLADELLLTAGSIHTLSINGVPYSFPGSTYRAFNVDTKSGVDRTTIIDSSRSETFNAQPLQASFSANDGTYQFNVSNSQTVVANSVAGGQDTAEFFDGVSSDHFFADATQAFLYGLDGSFNNVAVGFNFTRAWKTQGGQDVAILYDGLGNDELLATATSAKLQSDLGEFSNEAVSFNTIHAYSINGGSDRARLYDTGLNDTFYADSTQAFLKNDVFLSFASLFEDVEAFSTQGGSDIAILFDGAGDDTLESFPTSSTLRANNDSFSNTATAFETVYGYSRTGGIDQAILNGSVGRESFVGGPDFSVLEGLDSPFKNYATDFATVTAIGGGGDDLASLFDSVSDDRAEAIAARTSVFLPGTQVSVQSFPVVYLTSSRGGLDSLDQGTIGYTLIPVGPWV